MARASTTRKTADDISDRESLVQLLAAALEVCMQLREPMAAEGVMQAIRILDKEETGKAGSEP